MAVVAVVAVVAVPNGHIWSVDSNDRQSFFPIFPVSSSNSPQPSMVAYDADHSDRILSLPHACRSCLSMMGLCGLAVAIRRCSQAYVRSELLNALKASELLSSSDRSNDNRPASNTPLNRAEVKGPSLAAQVTPANNLYILSTHPNLYIQPRPHWLFRS